MPITIGESLYTLREVAPLLGLSLGSVRNYVAQGRIKAIRLDEGRGSVLIASSELDRFVREDRRPRGNPNLVAKSARKAGV